MRHVREPIVNAQVSADIGGVTASHRSDEIAVVDYE
jgi:hypothetical protein